MHSATKFACFISTNAIFYFFKETLLIGWNNENLNLSRVEKSFWKKSSFQNLKSRESNVFDHPEAKCFLDIALYINLTENTVSYWLNILRFRYMEKSAGKSPKEKKIAGRCNICSYGRIQIFLTQHPSAKTSQYCPFPLKFSQLWCIKRDIVQTNYHCSWNARWYSAQVEYLLHFRDFHLLHRKIFSVYFSILYIYLFFCEAPLFDILPLSSDICVTYSTPVLVIGTIKVCPLSIPFSDHINEFVESFIHC